MKSHLLIAATFVLSVLSYVACGGDSNDGNASGAAIKATPGTPCEAVGAKADAVDGCNTCVCGESGWSCTEVACNQHCTEGATSGSGCNSCRCSNGAWLCTDVACPEDASVPECPAPREPDPDPGCTQGVVYARSPETGACCMYGNPCVAPEGWQTFNTEEACQGEGECTVGDTMPAGDGCNTCSCTRQGWVCTLIACGCTPGETRRAEDGCNVCTCTSDGQWGGCTKRACTGEPIGCGARLGDTCTDDEYCAYEQGQHCGAADAGATCKPRPTGCTRDYAPVCGCDGKTHSNACVANSAGTGINYIGPCASAL